MKHKVKHSKRVVGAPNTNKEKVLDAGIGKVANELNGWRKKKKLN